jgi:CxxC motif-containing protein (DUF1111 family)
MRGFKVGSAALALALGLGTLAGGGLIAPEARGAAKARGKVESSAQDPVALGLRLFVREWVADDPRSHGGDGLGPVFNDRSCVACHSQGGTGGGGAASKNVDVLSAFVGSSLTGNQQCVRDSSDLADDPLVERKLVDIHPGFAVSASVVLHRFGLSPAYESWRRHLMSPTAVKSETNPEESGQANKPSKVVQLPRSVRYGKFTLLRTERNPTALFGAALIDDIPDRAIEAAQKAKHPAFPTVKGRLSRTRDGRIGRFGWKAQIATLNDFVLTACAVELGLEVPGHRQAGDPLGYAERVTGLDLSQTECMALVSYVRSLPTPVVSKRTSPGGEQIFDNIGCAACHTPKLGTAQNLYSDLLLHDMGEELQDTGSYGVFTPRSPGEEVEDPIGPLAGSSEPGALATRGQQEAKPSFGASRREWRTPPLWGVADSAPYLHDGRAENLDMAIRLHGGEAVDSVRYYVQLPAVERLHLLKFLCALRAPSQHDRTFRPRQSRSVVEQRNSFRSPLPHRQPSGLM